MTFEKLLEFLTRTWQADVLILAKLGMLLLLFLYLIFSLVVTKQIKLMSKTVNGVMEENLLLASKILVGLAVAVFIMALIIL